MHLPRLWEWIVIAVVALVVIGLLLRARGPRDKNDSSE